MASNKCNVDLTHPMTGYGKQNKDEKIIVKITDRTQACVSFDTRKYLAITKGEFLTYNPLARPTDQLNCNPDFCDTMGTLYVTPADPVPGTPADGDTPAVPGEGSSAGAKFQIWSNALAYTPQGIFGIYVFLPVNGEYNIDLQISDIADSDGTDSYVISKKIVADKGADWYLILFELDDVESTTETGKGWTPSQRGITANVEVTAVPETVGIKDAIGFSTINIYDSKTELQKNAAVILSCIDSFQDDQSVDATDAACLDGGYNASTLKVTKTITATTMTQNSYWLNPLEHKTDNVEGFFPVTVEAEVLPYEWNGQTFGIIHLTDMAEDQCGWITVSSGNKCEEVFQSTYSSHALNLNATEFIELKGNFNEIDHGAIIVSKEYIGESLMVTYPRAVTVEEYVADDTRLEGWHAEVQVPVMRKDHKVELRTYRNIYITSISQTFNTADEVKVGITFEAYRDENKAFYTKWIVADSALK